MYLKNIQFSDFRNYGNLVLEFGNGINIIYGNNGMGKTNVLEGIYICAITKSYRALKDSEYIKFGKESSRISCIFEDNEKKSNIEVYVDSKGTKQIKENEVKIKKYTEYIGKYPIVMFCPEDMNIVKGMPKNRRKFLDILISQISKKYVMVLGEYKKTLNIKNNLLKQNNVDINYLKILNEKLANQIVEIVDKRKEYIEKLWINSKIIQSNISKEKEELKLVYQSEFLGMDYGQVLAELNNCIQIDIIKKTSTKGIGHDDLCILVNEKDVSKFGSQGQNRTALLSLKIGEFELLMNEKGTVPIILLDDVFSELDNERINYLLEYIKNYQVFITTTMVDNIKIKEAKFFDVNVLAKN